MKNNNYIKGKMEYKFNYTILPSALFENPIYKNLSAESKLLYSFLLNRTNISLSNHWLDKKGRVYIIFTREEAQNILNCGANKATKTFKELVKSDLIDDVKQNNKKANLIYVKLPLEAEKNEKKVKANKQAKKTFIQRQKDYLKKINTYIKVKSKKLKKLKEIIKVKEMKAYEKKVLTVKNEDIEQVKDKIEYKYFFENMNHFNINKSLLDTIVNSIVEMKLLRETKINGFYYTNFQIKYILNKLSSCTIIEFLENFKNISLENIRNIKSYIKSNIINIIENDNLLEII